MMIRIKNGGFKCWLVIVWQDSKQLQTQLGFQKPNPEYNVTQVASSQEGSDRQHESGLSLVTASHSKGNLDYKGASKLVNGQPWRYHLWSLGLPSSGGEPCWPPHGRTPWLPHYTTLAPNKAPAGRRQSLGQAQDVKRNQEKTMSHPCSLFIFIFIIVLVHNNTSSYPQVCSSLFIHNTSSLFIDE